MSDTNDTFRVELNVSEHVDPELFKLITGYELGEPRPKPRYRFEMNGHVIEAELDNEFFHPQEHYKHKYTFTNGVFLCGPHDEEGNHIGHEA